MKRTAGLAAVLLLATFAATAGPAMAFEHPVCPIPPSVYAGTDPVVSQLVALRTDLRDACLVQRYDAQEASKDALALIAAVDAAVVADAEGTASLERWLAPLGPTDATTPSLHDVSADASTTAGRIDTTTSSLLVQLEDLNASLAASGDATVGLRQAPEDPALRTDATFTSWPAEYQTVQVQGVDPVAVGEKAEAVSNNVNSTLWFVVGLVTVGLVGYTILRQVMPR